MEVMGYLKEGKYLYLYDPFVDWILASDLIMGQDYEMDNEGGIYIIIETD